MNSECNEASSKDPLEYITPYMKEAFTLHPTSKREIIKTISDLNDKRSSGYDLILNHILKSCCKTVAPYITDLFNQWFASNTFPSPFKIAHVVPLL